MSPLREPCSNEPGNKLILVSLSLLQVNKMSDRVCEAAEER